MPDKVEVKEAALSEADAGLIPEGDGWFIVNIAESQGLSDDRLGSGAMFEATIGDFPQLGINVRLLEPGQPASMYHRENHQEAFLVLSGECIAIVEGEERTMRKGDFLHSPPGTAHVIVGGGDGPSSVLMVGARTADPGVTFPVSEAAARYGASVEDYTEDPAVANAGVAPRPAKLGKVPW
ncbi:MAG TPA: cupin domain-containing protein [Solirubrobacterales bacterium]|nr:cupin domain-containing protein [Solirubrobacterales bacterium]